MNTPNTLIDTLFDIRGKTYVLAGAAGTVGMNLCSLLVQGGAKIAAIDINPTVKMVENLEHSEELLVRSYICDLTDSEAVKRTTDEVVADFGSIDVLVNLTCTFGSGELVNELKYERWEKDIEINLHSVFLTCKEFGACMIKQGWGNIVNFASTASFFYIQGSPKTSYCASKSAIVSLTRSLAYEWAPYGIRVNAVAPGFIDIRENLLLNDKERPYSQREKERISKIPLHRFACTKDLVGPIIMLSSPAASYITGEVIMIDGGFTLSM